MQNVHMLLNHLATSSEQEDLKERVSLCENEVSAQRLQTENLQSAFYRISKFILLVQNVITGNLNEFEEAVGRIGQHRESDHRPLYLPCKMRQSRVFKARHTLGD